jgi:hypothetical protein
MYPFMMRDAMRNGTSKLAYYLVEEPVYTNVFNVDDDIVQWISENRPVQNVIKTEFEMYSIKGLI